MIIDTETHLIPRLDYLGRIDLEFSPELLIAEMDNAGVSKAVIISYEMKDVQWIMELGGKDMRYRRVLNKEYYINALKKYPDRFIWFTYGFDPDNKDYLDIVKEDIEIGAKGIKLLPAVTGFTMDDKRLIPLFKLCEKKKLPIILGNEYWNYTERPPHTDDFSRYCRPIHRIMGEYDINWLLAHLGCSNHTNEYPHPYGKVKKSEMFKNLDELAELCSHKNVWLENAYTVAYFKDEDYPYPSLQKMMKKMIETIGIDKFIFATDWPYTENFCTYRQQVQLIRNTDYLTEEDKDKFLSQNVKRYLNY